MPRTTGSARGIALASIIAGLGLLTACTPPMPPDVLAAVAEDRITCRSGPVDVGVPDGLAGVMAAIGGALTGVCPEQVTNEVLDGRSAPVRLIGTAPTAEDAAVFRERACPVGEVVSVPAFAYGVSLAYNVIGLEGLVLTREATAGILAGTVTSWQDPLISDENPDYDLSGLPEITVLAVDRDFGPARAMGEWLSEGDPLSAADLVLPTLPELLAELTAIEGAVAVVPTFAAVGAGLPVAATLIDGRVVDPADSQQLKIGAGAMNVAEDQAGSITATPAIGGVPIAENLDLDTAKVVLADGQRPIGWPVLGVAHLLVCADPADPRPLSLAQYALRLAGQGAAETFGLTPLPEPIRLRTFAPLEVQVPEVDAS